MEKCQKKKKQRSYISGLTTLIIAKKIWKILKNSKSVGYMYCDGNVLKKNKTIKSITSDNFIPLTKITGPKFKKLMLNTYGNMNDINKNDINKIIKNKEEKGLFKKNKFKVVTSECIINNGCKSKYSPYNFLYLINKKSLRPKAQKELVYISFIGYRFGKERKPLVNKIAKIISLF